MARRSQKIRSGTVKVEGLTELNRALRAIGPDAQKELGAASREVATFVANDARARAYGLGSTAAHVAPSIRAVGGVSSAGVSFGGAAYPMAGGAEFGSVRFKQFQPWRGNGPGAGYFVYPTIRADADQIVEQYEKRVNAIVDKRFPG